MEATPAVVAAYEGALPEDPRIARKRMFGMPCAFVQRQMFFGTFDQTVVARVGPERAEELAGQPGMRLFTPTEGRTWTDYVQVDLPADADLLAALASEALDWAAALPAKVKRPKSEKRSAKR